MLKIIIGIIIIYILYNVAKEYKESKKFNEKIEKEKREIQRRGEERKGKREKVMKRK